jgi:hypothetical protein
VKEQFTKDGSKRPYTQKAIWSSYFITNFVMNVRIIVGGAETIWFGKSSIPKFYLKTIQTL